MARNLQAGVPSRIERSWAGQKSQQTPSTSSLWRSTQRGRTAVANM